MCLFAIGVGILVMLAVFLIAITSVIGASAIIVFGDVIVCAFIIGLIIKIMLKNKKNKKNKNKK